MAKASALMGVDFADGQWEEAQTVRTGFSDFWFVGLPVLQSFALSFWFTPGYVGGLTADRPRHNGTSLVQT